MTGVEASAAAEVEIAPGRPLVFNHIPKTAGTAVSVALIEAVQPQHPFIGIDHYALGSNTMRNLSAVARRNLLTSPEKIPAESDFVYGHIAPSTTRARFPQAKELTILREPRARVLSHWLFSRTYRDFMLHGWGDWADDVKAARLPLHEFLSNPRLAYYTDNLITRSLVVPHDLTPVDRFIDEADDDAILEAATASLERFGLVDVVENPDLAGALSTFIGREVRIGRVNETQPMPPSLRCDVAAECTNAAALLAARTRIDAQLWDRVARRSYLGSDVSPHEERAHLFAAAIERHERKAAAEGPGVLTRATVSTLLRLRVLASSVKHYVRAKTKTGIYANNG